MPIIFDHVWMMLPRWRPTWKELSLVERSTSCPIEYFFFFLSDHHAHINWAYDFFVFTLVSFWIWHFYFIWDCFFLKHSTVVFFLSSLTPPQKKNLAQFIFRHNNCKMSTSVTIHFDLRFKFFFLAQFLLYFNLFVTNKLTWWMRSHL